MAGNIHTAPRTVPETKYCLISNIRPETCQPRSCRAVARAQVHAQRNLEDNVLQHLDRNNLAVFDLRDTEASLLDIAILVEVDWAGCTLIIDFLAFADEFGTLGE